MVELARFDIKTIDATLYNQLVDLAWHRLVVEVTYNGNPVSVRKYTRLEGTSLYSLENKKLDVIA